MIGAGLVRNFVGQVNTIKAAVLATFAGNGGAALVGSSDGTTVQAALTAHKSLIDAQGIVQDDFSTRWSQRPVNLREFGAVGDGVADDTAALSAWIAAIARTGAAGAGRRGYIPPGVYLWSGVLTIPACIIDGAGTLTTVLRAKDATARLVLQKTPVYDESQGAHGVYSDFTVDGAGVSAGPLVRLTTQNFWRLDSVAILNSAGDALELAGAQNGIASACVISSNAGVSVALRKDSTAGGADGAQGNLFLKCEISKFGTRAVSLEDNSFNDTFSECGIEYSTASSLEAVRVNCAAAHENTLFFRGGFVGVNTAIPVFRLQHGTTSYEGGQVHGSNVGTALFYLDGSGVLLKTAGSCEFDLATDLFFAHNVLANVYDNANYFTNAINVFNTDVGAQRDSVLSRPLSSQLVLRRGQVQFPAVQAPSTNVNTLDDYAEGTFTPALLCGGSAVGVTTTTASGTYRKIGSLVFVTIKLNAGIAGATAGPVTIGGLPFASGGAVPGAFAFGGCFGVPAGAVLYGEVSNGPSQTIKVYNAYNGAARAANSAMQTSELSATCGLNLSGCYVSAS